MKYKEALTKLNARSKFGIILGLERISTLLERMGNPQNKLKFIHIAGTNGKGSTTTMLSNILQHSGYRTGLFISPFVLCFREVMQINGEMISETEFAECADFVFRCADNMAEICEYPTQFELETAIAFEWYQRKKCDIVCIEVGLGGRFDSTNIIHAPILQIITSISLDHTAILGDTIEKIAYEKAGIIKGGTTILYPLQRDEAVTVVKNKCKETNSLFVQPDLNQLTITKDHWLEAEFKYDGIPYRKSLPGKFQIYNCITVITAAEQLKKMGFNINDSDIMFGIENTYFPARMEVLSKEPLIILDGSHNPDGALALEQSLKELFPRPITMLMGVLADKEYHVILKSVGKYVEKFIAVTPNNPRALPGKDLCEEAKKVCKNTVYFEQLQEAVQTTLAELTSDSVFIICGSLYLAAEIRPLVLEQLQG